MSLCFSYLLSNAVNTVLRTDSLRVLLRCLGSLQRNAWIAPRFSIQKQTCTMQSKPLRTHTTFQISQKKKTLELQFPHI